MTLPFAMAQRAESGFSQRPYIRGEERTWSGGKPPHVFAPDGSWISTVAGVNADGSFMGGRDPSTGLYWPGDAWVGNRPAYFDELGPVPYMDPDGIHGPRDTFQGAGLTLQSAPASAPIAVATAAPYIPTVDLRDDGSRIATMSAGDEIRRAQTYVTAPTPTFALPSVFRPPQTTIGGAPQLAPVPFVKDPAGTYLVNGVLQKGDGTVLNVDRSSEADVVGSVGAGAGAGSGVQDLPALNTTATRVAFDWQKYLPILLGLLVLVAVFLAMKKSSRAS